MFPIETLRRADFEDAGERLGVPADVIRAVAAVEARHSGFIAGTDLPVILFEGHIFHKETGGRHSGALPTISYPKWTKAHYKGGRGEYTRLRRAIAADGGKVAAALRSASWGMFQIMGFNHRAAGYGTVEEFVNAMALGGREHLMAFISFVDANPRMLAALRSQDWREFARRYNGPGYEQNRYDTTMAAEFAKARADAYDLERGDWMALQAALNVRGAGIAVDGWEGPKTQGALVAFQTHAGLPTTGEPDAVTLAALGLVDELQEVAA